MSGVVRIWCLNQDVFDKVRSMWLDLPRPKRMAFKMARIKVESFELHDDRRGVDILINNSLIHPSHLLGEIEKSLRSEGFDEDDFNLEVL